MYYGFDIGGSKIALGVFNQERRLQWENASLRRKVVMRIFSRR